MMVTGVLVSLKAAWGETSSIQLDHGACVLVCVLKRISFWLSRSSWVLYGTCTYFWSCHPFPKPPTSLSKTPRCKPTVSNTLAGKHTHTLTSKCKEANSFFFFSDPESLHIHVHTQHLCLSFSLCTSGKDQKLQLFLMMLLETCRDKF